MTDREQLCREFTELTGGHWHEFLAENNGQYQYSCLNCVIYQSESDLKLHIKKSTPTYENPADVLKAMMKRDDYDDFLRELQKNHWLEIEEFIEKYILEPDALLREAVAFLKEN